MRKRVAFGRTGNPGMGGPQRAGSKRKRAAGPGAMANPRRHARGGGMRGSSTRQMMRPGANPSASKPHKRKIFSGN